MSDEAVKVYRLRWEMVNQQALRPDGRLVSVMLDCGDEAELIMLPGVPIAGGR